MLIGIYSVTTALLLCMFIAAWPSRIALLYCSNLIEPLEKASDVGSGFGPAVLVGHTLGPSSVGLRARLDVVAQT